MREAWDDTAENLLTPGVYVTPSTVKALNPALPNDMTYDSFAFRHTNGKIRWGYTSQTLASGSNPYRMGLKVTETDDFQSFTYIGSYILDGVPLGIEGIRAVKVNGRKYFVGAGHEAVYVFDADAQLIAQFDQPAEVHGGGFGSHAALSVYRKQMAATT